MSVAMGETLSPDEMRKRLYQTFKNRGVLDTLKTQLRNQLIIELKHPLNGEMVSRPVTVKIDSLLALASNSLVADHLRSSGYEYSLSVFSPECGLSMDKAFSTTDLLQLMKINPQSSLYRKLASDTRKDRRSFLISLLMDLTDHQRQGNSCDADTQTTVISNYRESLVDKMKMIDEEYETSRYKGDKWVSYESKLAAYRKDIESQMQAEMDAKLQHFKDVEIVKVKMKEKEKCHKEFEKLKQNIEKSYELKAEALINREKNAIDRLQKQQEIEEKDGYMQRQSVLKEMETIRRRESELKFRIENFEKTCKIHEEKTKAMEEMLRRRELAVKTMEDTYDQKLKNELSRYELELKEDYVKRTEKLTENETRNKMENSRIQNEAAAISAKSEELNNVCSEQRRLQVELETARQQVSLQSQQNQLLRERLEAMSDYPGLRKEKLELQGQLRLLKRQQEETQEENQHLHTELTQPSTEQLALQGELRRLQAARRLDQEEFDSQRQVLQAQLQSEVERCAQLKGQQIECEERSQWLTTHAEELKMQLRQTQQALENEVLRNPKPSLVDRSVLELSPDDRLLPPDIYVDRALFRPRKAAYDDVCEAGGVPSRGQRRGPRGRSVSPDADTELLAGAKARIRELEKEADTLEEAFRNYQQRALHTTVSQMLPLPRHASPQRGPLAAHRPHSPPRQPVFQRSRPHPAQQDHARQRPGSPLRQHHTAHHSGPASPEPQHPTRTTSPNAHSARVSSPHQRTTSPPHHAHTTSPVPQARVTFSEERLEHQLSGPVGDTDPQSYASEAQLGGETASENASPPPLRRLSSTPVSLSRRRLHTKPGEESAMSPAPFPELSPPPRGHVASTGDFLSGLSPPCSPRLRSTARDDSSPPQVLQVFSSSESSPQPEKIAIEDLTDLVEEPSSHIPELLLDTTAIPLSKEAPRDLPDTHSIHTQGGVQKAPNTKEEEEEEDEELRWERERRERAERRQREQEDAQEREQRELERLEQERLLEEALQHRGGVEVQIERGEEKTKEEAEKAGPSEGKASEANPLEKYMKMVLEAREMQQVQTPGEANPEEHQSPEAKSLSEEKDDSVAAYSHDAVDDDFW